ncbi:MAG: DUF523 domain-containing protein [Epsilonproteobacteria bacterium]|nr:DUF523 domain-containing protein [Campylobacterota bacterium]
MKILVSACLLGHNVRYDAKLKTYDFGLFKNYDVEFISLCPEVEGGLAIPRPPSEIQDDGRIINSLDLDVTEEFTIGAQRALELVKKHNIFVAILKSKSPSCSNKMVYDGSFSGRLRRGKGITVKILEAYGVKVFDEMEIKEAIAYLQNL